LPATSVQIRDWRGPALRERAEAGPAKKGIAISAAVAPVRIVRRMLVVVAFIFRLL
jgi:hypothetical protein